MNAGVARPSKPCRISWNEDVNGLTRGSDGRWQITATDHRFTEPDERLAVSKAKPIITASGGNQFLDLEVALSFTPEELSSTGGHPISAAINRMARFENGEPLTSTDWDGEQVRVSQLTDPALIWPRLRECLIKDPAYIARMVGLPSVAGFTITSVHRPPRSASPNW